jgi:hypothetical protein
MTSATVTPLPAGEELERELDVLAGAARFAPPQAFGAVDAQLYARAAADPDAYWAEQARTLDWAVPFTQVLDESDAPFYRWFADGRLNAAHNCLDRHVEAGLGDRVAFHWPARRARSATSPTPICCATCSASPTPSRTSASARATSSGSTCR